MGALTVQNITDAGTKPSTTTPTASDTAAIGSGYDSFLVYRNTTATPFTVTVVVPGNTSYGQPLPDPQFTVVATTGEAWIPLRKAYDDGTGTVTVTTSAQPAGSTVALVKMG